MPTFTVRVVEVRHVECEYTVEAGTRAGALWLAEVGETEKEVKVRDHGVFGRHVKDGTLKEVVGDPGGTEVGG